MLRNPRILLRFGRLPSGFRLSSSQEQKNLVELPDDLPEFTATEEIASFSGEIYDKDGLIKLEQLQVALQRFTDSDRYDEDLFRELTQRDKVAPSYLETEKEEDQQQTDKNISKMRPYHRDLFHNRPPEFTFHAQTLRSNLKQRYARFGIASGVNPGVMWMTKEELAEQKAWDSTQEIPLEQSRSIVDKMNKEEKETREARIREVEENLEKYKETIQEYEDQINEKRMEQEEIDQARQEKIMEIQEYFGYAVDPSDPRFQKMMEQKEEEEKKAARLAKKREREARMIAQIREASETL